MTFCLVGAFFCGLISVQMTSFVVLGHQHGQNELVMLLKKALESLATVEEILKNLKCFLAVLKVRSEPIDINHDVNKGDSR